MSRDGRKTGGGSRKGKPNRATADVREAISELLKGNVQRLEGWLIGVADGEKVPREKDGKPVLGETGEPLMKWMRKPDPGYAMRLMSDIAEYHIPKLQRTDIHASIEAKGEMLVRVEYVPTEGES